MGRAEDIFERIKGQGLKAIDEFAQTRHSEELFLDFKRSADQGKGKVLNRKDRNNLAKAISGFGNSEGGVVVWGLDCSKDLDSADVVKAKEPILDVKKFASWIEGQVSGCTIPPHSGVVNHTLAINKTGEGFVITYIPKSENVPHQVIGENRYYIRAGSSFVPTPHDVLAGMFGRRPQPKISEKFIPKPVILKNEDLGCPVEFLAENRGPVIAGEVFASCLVWSVPGSNCDVKFIFAGDSFGSSKDYQIHLPNVELDRCFSAISKGNIRVPPGSSWSFGTILVSLKPPFSQNLKLTGLIGCANSPPRHFSLEATRALTEQLYYELYESRGLSTETQLQADLAKRLLSI